MKGAKTVSLHSDVVEIRELLMLNKDKLVQIIATRFVNSKQIFKIGELDINSLRNFFKYNEAYINYLKKGWTTVDKLTALINTKSGQISFEALGKHPDAVEKLLNIEIKFYTLSIFGLHNGLALRYILENVDSVIYMMQNKMFPHLKTLEYLKRKNKAVLEIFLQNLKTVTFLLKENQSLTVRKILNAGLKHQDLIKYLFKYPKVYTKYVKSGLTTFDALFELADAAYACDAFKALGMYPEVVYKLLEYGTTFDQLCKFGEENVILLVLLLQNVDKVIYLLENKHIDSFGALHEIGLESTLTLKILLGNIDSIILLVSKPHPITLDQITELQSKNIYAMEALLKYAKTYKGYLTRELVSSFDELIELIDEPLKHTAFEALGQYPETVDKLLKLGLNFGDLYTLGLQDPSRFIDLLSDTNSPSSQEWLKDRLPVIDDIDTNHQKLGICKLNALGFGLFMKKYNCNTHSILQLPLTVLQNFVEKNYDEKILINAMPDTKALLTQVGKEQTELDYTSL